MPKLVIKSWEAEPKPIDDKNNFVRIVGRQGGILSWFLSLLTIDPTTTIVVGLERIEFSSSSLAGTESRLIPLQSVCSSYYGYHKPWKAASAIVIFAISMAASVGRESFPLALICVAVGLVGAVVYYFLNRTLTLGFIEVSGLINGIQFKRSVIEGVEINQQQAKYVCMLTQRLIEAKGRRLAPSSDERS